MLKKTWIAITRMCGWTFAWPSDEVLQQARHAVIIMAPHTAVADFFLGAASLWTYGIESRIFMKKEYFKTFGFILRQLGVVAVDRGNRSNGLVDKASQLLKENPQLSIVITPEGTRKSVRRWKRGFYEIALAANVPVACTYLDYRKKEAGFKFILHPSGDFDTDMLTIMTHYQDVTARHPEGFNKQMCSLPPKKEPTSTDNKE